MKKYLLLLAAFGFFFFSSCSDDDDAAVKEHSIEGTWRLASVNPPLFSLDCSEDSTITFNANGTADWTLYDSENDCEAAASSGRWEKNSGDNYTVVIPDFGEVDGVVSFSSANSFSFVASVPGYPAQATLNFVK